MNWMQACIEMARGRRIRRLGWPEECYFRCDGSDGVIVDENGKEAHMILRYFTDNEWQLWYHIPRKENEDETVGMH